MLPGPGQGYDFGLRSTPAQRKRGLVGKMGRGLEPDTWDHQPAAWCAWESDVISLSLAFLIYKGALVTLAIPWVEYSSLISGR